jgi:Tfp pilus assembly protein PilN
VSSPLNLARRPLRNDRLPTTVLAVGCVLLGAMTLRHAVLAYQLRPGGALDTARELSALEDELGRLRTETASLRTAAPPSEKLKEWVTIKSLVDRRAFSWTGLFAALERALPPTVRLVSVAPTAEEGPTFLTLTAVGQSGSDAIALLRSLQSDPQFEAPFVGSTNPSPDGLQMTCSVRYVGGTGTRAGGGQ